ncbi:MAG: GGDEF domain-containing protein [Dehalococcoidia bacterium]|nr:GGDEF domain-containing protein [Dehalococcoidia bacterium]
MLRARVGLALVLLTAVGLFFLDVLLSPEFVFPVVLFAVPTIIAVYRLSTREVAGVAVVSIVLGTISLALREESLWITSVHFLALALICIFCAIISAKMSRHIAMAAEREQLLAELQRANEQLESDKSALRREEEALRASEERYRALAETAHDMIFIVDRDGYVQYVNPFAAEQFGLRPAEIIGKRREDLFPPHTSDHQKQSLQEVVMTGKPLYRENSVSFRGIVLWLDTWLTPLTNAAGEVVAVMGISRDITERKKYEEQLAYLASHDPLTGLSNRRSLAEAMDKSVARARRGVTSTILFLDVDNFKSLNDAFGHASGDQALVSLAKLLQNEVRFEDLLVRLGGDEFAVLMEGTNLEQAQSVSVRMCQAIKGFEFSMDGLRIALSLSVGIAVIDGQYDTSKILAQADTAMYRAKEQGGDKTVLHTGDGTTELKNLTTIESDKALD